MTTALDHVTTAVENHHESLLCGLTLRTEALVGAVADRRPYESAYQDLVDFLHQELLPHLEVEAGLLFTSAEQEGTALLVAAMLDEHRMMTVLVNEIERASNAMDLALAAGALVLLLDVCIHHENRYLLPALATSGVDLERLLDGAPEVVGAGDAR